MCLDNEIALNLYPTGRLVVRICCTEIPCHASTDNCRQKRFREITTKFTVTAPHLCMAKNIAVRLKLVGDFWWPPRLCYLQLLSV